MKKALKGTTSPVSPTFSESGATTSDGNPLGLQRSTETIPLSGVSLDYELESATDNPQSTYSAPQVDLTHHDFEGDQHETHAKNEPKKAVRFAPYVDDDRPAQPAAHAAAPKATNVHGSDKQSSETSFGNDSMRQLHQLLVTALQIIIQTSPAHRANTDVRAQFWKTYKTESEEFHIDFLRKYTDEMDSSLIFSGLFSAVNATFIAMMQPNLNADPNLTTQVLLMMVVQSLNHGAFAGQTLTLPTFEGPSSMTVWIQSLLYASLAASLFAALGAMMGKQWLGHYAKVGERGTVEERCIDRQRKLVALHTWHFHVVLQAIPLLLQLSLLLFGVGMAAYMWSQQRTIAWVLVSVVGISFLMYTLSVFCSLTYPDCPFHSPLADLVQHFWPYISHSTDLIATHLQRVYEPVHRRFIPSSPDDSIASLYSLPMTNELAEAQDRDRESSWHDRIINPIRKYLPLPRWRPAIFRLGLVQMARRGLDAYCIDWLLLTSTDPEDVTTAARMVLEVEWPAELNLRPMLAQLQDTFIRCFATQYDDAYHLLPHARDRASACGQALLYMHMRRRHREGANGDEDSNLHGVNSYLRHSFLMTPFKPSDIKWPSHWQGRLQNDDPDLQIICWALNAFSEPPLPQAPDDSYSSATFSTVSPNPLFMEWFSRDAIYCLQDPSVNPAAKLRIGTVLVHFFELHPLPHKKILSNCLMGCAILLGANADLDSGKNSVKSRTGLRATLIQLAALTQRESPRLRLRRDNAQNSIQSDFAQLLLKPLLDLLIQLNAADRFHSTLYEAEFHHWSLRLCRQLVTSTDDSRRSDWSAFRPAKHYARECVRKSVLTACPSSKDGDPIIASVWKTRYERTEQNPEPLTGKDYAWIFSLLRQAVPRLDGEVDEDLVADCLMLLCEIPNIGFRHDHSHRFFAILAWAGQQILSKRMRHAAMKLTRIMCGHQRDVNDFLLLSLVNNMGGIDQFAVTMSINSPLLDAGRYSRQPASYMWILAYLDLMHGLTAREDWLPYIHSHARQIETLAYYLSTDEGEEEWRIERPDNLVKNLFVGWDVDIRSWKLQDDRPSGHYRNTYIRDILYRIAQIMVRFERLRPVSMGELPSSPSESTKLYVASQARARLSIACAAWQIYDTHPLPDAFVPKMAGFSRDVIKNAPHELLAERIPILESAAGCLYEAREQMTGDNPLRVELRLLEYLIEDRLAEVRSWTGSEES
ncbi:hypothetical protein EUX98_g5022 [Antrodiella citrinella]|uniref:DUF6535 domain-containing protein n=1 Tax=Antrodiella citrinella TaxID=2447956 RepID=A0A4S4N0G0_9APHY|nr:hypothetical protein EUX98_g5022 [Antrodiella citrinella]